MAMTVGTYRLGSIVSVDDDSKAADRDQLTAKALNDPAAFVQLYRRHYDAVFRYCVHRLFERQAAEDATSQVFLKVIENLSRFKGTEHQFRNWLYRIATNAVNDHLRKAVRRNALLRVAREQANSQDTDCKDTSDEKLAVVRQAVLSLKLRYQTIITLRFFENMKLTEIADVLACSQGTVRSQLARALARLRSRLITSDKAT
jgi:RNA polymerase sigma-70 factor (ECF subfamily)